MWNFNDHKKNTALISEDGTMLTYEQLGSAGANLASAMGERCLVFSLCTNTIGSVLGYTAFLTHGIVPVLLNANLEDELLLSLLATYKPKYMWLPTEFTEKFTTFKSIYSSYGYTLMKTAYEKEYLLFPELGLLMTTSGSTGSPKLVRQSYSNVKANTESIAQYLELDVTERAVTTLPMNYSYGLSIINTHLLVGATILLTEKTLMQKDFWTFLKTKSATSFGGVPYTYEILDKLRFFRMDLPHLRTMTQAGGKLSTELHKKFAKYALEQGKKFVVMYGQCEATSRMSYLPYERSVEKSGSIGVAIPGGKFSIIDEDGEEITDFEVTGELVYYGQNVTLGYAECGNDLSKGDVRNGKLVTGDMAKCDKDGFYYIVGRKKRFLKIYGNRVNMDEMDQLIKSHFNSIDCASTGVDDQMYIFITAPKLEDEVKSFVAEKTGINRAAFKVVVLNEIPKNDSGKILYRELDNYYR